MPLQDKQGREIKIGTYIIYPTTGTIGKVLKIKKENKQNWVLIQYDELTRLWYNTDYIEVTDKKYKKQETKTETETQKEDETEKIKEKLNKTLSAELNDDAVGGG